MVVPRAETQKSLPSGDVGQLDLAVAETLQCLGNDAVNANAMATWFTAVLDAHAEATNALEYAAARRPSRRYRPQTQRCDCGLGLGPGASGLDAGCVLSQLGF